MGDTVEPDRIEARLEMGARTVAPLAAQASPLITRRALVVDDDGGVRRLVSRALGAQGIQVDQAGTGEDGLRRALTVPYDVVVLDLQLPGLDGLTVLRYLLSARPAQAVIASSCRSDPATKSECLCAGARAFLAKPFSLTDLLASVADALASSPFSRAGGQALSPARLGPG